MNETTPQLHTSGYIFGTRIKPIAGFLTKVITGIRSEELFTFLH